MLHTFSPPLPCQSNISGYNGTHLWCWCEWQHPAVWPILWQGLEPLCPQLLHEPVQSWLVACCHAAGCVPDEALTLQQQGLTLAVIVLHRELPGLGGVRLDLALGTQQENAHTAGMC